MIWLSLGVKQITSMINYYSERNYNILNYLLIFTILMILISYLVILMTTKINTCINVVNIVN